MGYTVDQLHPGDVLLIVPSPHEPIWDRALDDAIAWSSGPFVHGCLVGEGHLIEQLGTVQQSPLDKYVENGWRYAVEGATPEAIQGTLAWAEAHLGQVYGAKAILADALVYDLHDWHALSLDPRYVTCAGFVERAWRLGGGITLSGQPLVSPTGLAFSPRLIGPRPWDRLPQ